MTKGKLIVRNVEQQAAMLELDGQFSDGMWENARPDDHWKPWCDADVVVARAGELRGRTFYARKDNYNITSRELLDVVGKRMLGIIRIARRFGIEVATVLEHAVDCETGRIDWKASWNQDRIAAVKKLGVDWPGSIDAALADVTYTHEHMLVDLRDLKKIMKTQLTDRSEGL